MNIQQLNTKVLDTMLEMLKPNNTLTTLELKLELKNKGVNLNQEAVSKFMSAKADEGLLSYTDNGTYRTYSLIKQQYDLKSLDKRLFELFEKREYINSKLLKLKVIIEDRVSLPNSTIVDYLKDKVREGVLNFTKSDFNIGYSLVKQKQTTTMKNNVEVKVEYVNKTTLIETLKNNKGKRLTVVFTTKDKELRTYNGMFTGHVTNLGWYQFRLRNDSEGNKVYKQFDAKNLLEVRVNKVIYKLEDIKKKKELSFTITDGITTYKHKIPTNNIFFNSDLKEIHERFCESLSLNEEDFQCIKGC